MVRPQLSRRASAGPGAGTHCRMSKLTMMSLQLFSCANCFFFLMILLRGPPRFSTSPRRFAVSAAAGGDVSGAAIAHAASDVNGLNSTDAQATHFFPTFLAP